MRKPFELIGQRFGHWEVVARDKRGPGTYWQCVCDCGNPGVIRGKALVTGRSKSCGCRTGEKKKPIRRVRRAMFELVELIKSSGFSYCHDCGKLVMDVDLDKILKGVGKTAKPLPPTPTKNRWFGTLKEKPKEPKKTPRKTKYQIGQKFGDWILKSRSGQRWTVECSKCGKHLECIGSRIVAGKTKCVCHPDFDARGSMVKPTKLIPSNKRFGNLFVREMLGTNGQGEQVYQCKCLCGGDKIATGEELLSGHTTHCGCKTKEKE